MAWKHASGILMSGFAGTLRACARAARQLLDELAGTLFLVFTAIGAGSAWRLWRAGAEDWRIGVSLGFALVMGIFAATSFLRARRVS